MILPSGLQYTLKRVGPKTDPCGTPYLSRLQQERELFTFTEVVRSTRYDQNHSKALSLTPMSARRRIRISCCKVSKADLRSSRQSTTSRLRLSDRHMSLKIFTVTVSVLWYGLYALWNGSFIPLTSRSPIRWTPRG